MLLAADHSAPVVTFQVTYRVGSRNEVTGTTGATHLLEHLMFKGSENFNDPKGNSIKQYPGACRRPVQCEHRGRPDQLLRHHRAR